MERVQGDDIFFFLSDLLAELKDGHVALYSRGGGSPVIPYITPRQLKARKLYDPEIVRNYFPLSLTGENNIEYGISPERVGYIYIGAFKEGTWAYDIDAVLDGMKDVKGLIIDVRSNGGGTTDASEIILGRFIEYQLQGPQFYRHGVKLPLGYVRARGPYQWKKPTVVLINGASFSTAEIFPEMMKQLPFVTAIGDTTGGGGGGYDYYPLPSGTKIRIPMQEFLRYDGMRLEWNGVLPDSLVIQNPQHLVQGHDDQLEYALNFLR